ncbi:MAG TPA: 16S rRNA (cytosine(967)-C(5))-methyltransferase RsmB [Pyrinomonadaceae bacterium]|nr:16S rRNA (cytosine(967)-C(5))-methyltransferase RsmB [Pyrinomonadaceae bacterium]
MTKKGAGGAKRGATRGRGAKRGGSVRAKGAAASSTNASSNAVSPARRAAFEILRRVEEEGAFAAPLLASLSVELDPEDRALCHELVLGVLRRQLWLDRALAHFSARAPDALDTPVRLALRLGLYQLRFLTRTPAHAAVNESVNIVHAARLRSAAPLVNAVLRRATREPDYDPAASATDAFERIAVETSHPAWLIERWAEAFGLEETHAFARANNEPAPVAFRVNSLRADSASLIERIRNAGAGIVASRVAPDAWRVEESGGGASSALLRALAAEGAIYMQDEASQLVAHVLDARAGERVLDACAAPGSKTTHLATLMRDAGLVVAGDVHQHRLRVVSESAARQGLTCVRAVAIDAEASLPFAPASFDRVLVDAPCTGTGTLRHNPEIRWRITPPDIAELAARQLRILVNAATLVRAGGRLVYSTCSVEREENESVVVQFLKDAQGFEQVAARPARVLAGTGAARTWPHREGADGFFVAAFERRK